MLERLASGRKPKILIRSDIKALFCFYFPFASTWPGDSFENEQKCQLF